MSPSSSVRAVLASIALSLLAAPGCSCSGGILLAVDVRTDLVPGVEFDEVEIQVDDAPATHFGAAVGDPFDRGRRVFETEGLELGRHDLEVTLMLRGARVVGRSYVVRLDGNLVVLAILTRDCRGVTCPGAGDSAAATECLGGTCVDPECGTLSSDACVSECEDDGDCSSPTSCVVPVCVSGVCLEGSAPTSCPSGEYCQPGEGCLPIPVSGDGSVPRPDAGTCMRDADCDDGFSCTVDACVGGRCENTETNALCTTGIDPRCAPDDGAADPVTGCVAEACSAATCVAGPCETAECFEGSCVRSELCADTEMCCAGTCAASCSAVPCDGQPAGTVCRAAAGDCDAEEVCDGSSPLCPDDAFTSGGVCRPAAGSCDVAESCSGGSADCPMDAFVTIGTGCSGGFCDGSGTCSSTCTPGADCPTADACSIGTVSCSTGTPVCGAPFRPASAGTTCRDAAGTCDVAEVCNGSSTSCPSDGFATSGTCRSSAGGCDIAESCNGSGPDCPGDARRPAGFVCRAETGDGCDVAETCNGSGASCPANAFRPSSFVCRADSGGGCDVAETCTGSSATCPADAFRPGSFVCRMDGGGGCDVAETCTGSSGACPTNAFRPSGFVCRMDSGGGCDVAETCSGSSGTCPVNGFRSAGFVCRPAGTGGCDVAESCSGGSANCPADAFRPAGFVCRADSGAACDLAETCSGGSATCPPDASNPLGNFAEACCSTSIDSCRAGECLAGTCAAFGGAYAVQGESSDECVPNPITGACTCPAGFIDQELIDMDGNVDEGQGWESYLHVCRTPSAVSGGDFRGAFGEVTGLPGGSGCMMSCADPNPYTGACSCPVSTAEDEFLGIHYQSGSPLDCQRAIGMCRSLPTSPLTYGGTYRVFNDPNAYCTDIPAGLRCQPNTITGACSCPSGFVGMTYNAMMRHTDQVTHPNGFCRALMTVCVRSP